MFSYACSHEAESFAHQVDIKQPSTDTVGCEQPPFSGTIFIDSNIIIPEDSSSFESIIYRGQEVRDMFDRRENNWIEVDPFLFHASYSDGNSIEIQVNPEFETIESAKTIAEEYASVIGQLPLALRLNVETTWIHKGTELFGGGNNNLLIHTGQASNYIENGILEETLIHEAAHTSLDGNHATTSDWIAAQEADNCYISDYAQNNSVREDIAESFLPWLAVRYKTDQIPDDLRETIESSIPNRLKYFDEQGFDLYPLNEN